MKADPSTPNLRLWPGLALAAPVDPFEEPDESELFRLDEELVTGNRLAAAVRSVFAKSKPIPEILDLLRSALWLALGGWVGSWAFFAFVVSRLAFQMLPGDVAGDLAGVLLGVLHFGGAIAAFVVVRRARGKHASRAQASLSTEEKREIEAFLEKDDEVRSS